MLDDSVSDRLRRLRSMMPAGRGEFADLESMPGPAPVDDGPIDRVVIREIVGRTECELLRIVKEYLDDGPVEKGLVAEIVERGDRALRLVGKDAEFERRPELLADLEAIIRPDGRPSFLVRDGRVDMRSSPLGRWDDSLYADEHDLEKAITCIGRIDAPGLIGGYAGTGVLIHDDLILTNRHVVQMLAGRTIGLLGNSIGDAAIDFGHEYRGHATIGRRKLKKVAFVGDQPVDPYDADHGRLDLAVIELEPPPAGGGSRFVMSVDAAPVRVGAGGPPVYAIGYPYRPDPGLYTPTLLDRLFDLLFGYKRLAPGQTIASRRSTAAWTAAHDATTLGGNSGSAIVRAGTSLGLLAIHYGGTSTEPAENWGHVLGLALPARGEAGEKLLDALDRYHVEFSNRP
ncbi:trypsin-like serine peptidase [Aquisphaera insulae]|uniref:trypsin-like serine peptidase n=1 Tax=Aquisphaera insulae TaxID=2712864 RepID=UPI0013EA8390|nr:serine protease [Aquisphaera insulae]